MSRMPVSRVDKSSPLTALVAKGAVAGLAGMVVGSIVGLLTAMILTRALSPEDFGVLSLAKSYLTGGTTRYEPVPLYAVDQRGASRDGIR